jgi:ring-1,2-phenylacetyl-CoA epoxidase subunit PaaD
LQADALVSNLVNDALARAREAVASVCDPEIPVLSLTDLGIVREVALEDGRIAVSLTPTYTGCPATEVICEDVLKALAQAGLPDAQVRMVLSPAWTTDWITETGRRKLREYGIAPPARVCGNAAPVTLRLRWMPKVATPAAHSPSCPRCASDQVERLSEFGSTACKALWRCLSCREPFDYFKPY